jgi:hypothetical protein
MSKLIKIVPPKRFVFTGVGIVSMHEILIAKADNAAILAYNVGVEKTALKEAEVSAAQFSLVGYRAQSSLFLCLLMIILCLF